MAAQNLGEWDAEPVESGLDPSVLDGLFEIDESGEIDQPEGLGQPDGETRGALGPLAGPRTGALQHSVIVEAPEAGAGRGAVAVAPHLERDHGEGRDARFWLRVMVGLLPVVALVSGLIGYLLARSGDDGTTAEAATSAGAGVLASGRTAGSDAAGADAGLPVETTAVPTSTAPPPPDSLVATGLITDGTIELAGALPAARQAQWTSEIGDLADVLGARVVDGTEVADAGTGSADLTVRFPSAVVFTPESSARFVGDPNPNFEAIAGVLNRGTSELTIVAFADPTDPDAGILALSRAAHVRDHLSGLGVDPDRLAVEARPPADAPAVADDVPVTDRADVEFQYRS